MAHGVYYFSHKLQDSQCFTNVFSVTNEMKTRYRQLNYRKSQHQRNSLHTQTITSTANHLQLFYN